MQAVAPLRRCTGPQDRFDHLVDLTPSLDEGPVRREGGGRPEGYGYGHVHYNQQRLKDRIGYPSSVPQ